MRIRLHVWRQEATNKKGKMESYDLDDVLPDMSFLEMMDVLNEKLTRDGDSPVAFDHDCRVKASAACARW